MKKVINGKVYDTSTAIILANYENTSDENDLKYFKESLYTKKTGEYFIYAKGNGQSKYARTYGDGSKGQNEKIIPYSYDAAHLWAKANLDKEKFDELFGTLKEEENNRVTISITLWESNHKKLKRYAAQTNNSLSSVIDELIENLY